MSESSVMEIYQIEVFGRNTGWNAHQKTPWIMKSTMCPCSPPEEIGLPSGDWCWYSNWRIDKQPGITDEDGWGYASRMSRLHKKDRRPKPEALWSRARRRLWSRVMRREASLRNVDLQKVLPGVQKGLTGVNAARLKIEEIIKADKNAAKSEQMVNLVMSVKRNITDILSSLDSLEKQTILNQQTETVTGLVKHNHMAVIKKLRNDVSKEEAAIDRAINPLSSKSNRCFLPLRKQLSLNHDITNIKLEASNGCQDQSTGSIGKYSNGVKSSNEDDERSDILVPVVGNAPISHKQKQGSSFIVKGGSSSAFNMGVFNQCDVNFGNGVPDDGTYMDRTVQELLIERKFVAVDEATVMQEIIDERSVEIEKVYQGLAIVHEMFTDLSKIVDQQSSHINEIYQNVDESNQKTKDAFEHIVEANRLQNEGTCVIF